MKANLGVRPPATRRSPSFRRKSARLFAALLLPILATFLVFAGQANPKDKPNPWLAQGVTQRTWPGQADRKDKGAQPWLFKDWTKWTSNDCGLVLSNSPWSHRTSYNPFAGNGQGYKETLLQFSSALPVRQALLRDLQLQKRYDKMNDTEKQGFDREHSLELTGHGDDNVVIVVSNSSYQPPIDPNSQGPSAQFFAPEPPTQIALSLSDGTLLQPTQTKVGLPSVGIDLFMNRMEYTFPRAINGKPLYSPSDAFLVIYRGAVLVVDKKTGKTIEQTDFRNSRLAYEFEISDLMYKGKLEY
jgi:hypothetical protein